MVGKSPFRPRTPFPAAVALLAIVLFLAGLAVTSEAVARAFARQLGPSSPSVLGMAARSAWIDPRRALPAIWSVTWHCYGLAWNRNTASQMIVPARTPSAAHGVAPAKTPPRCPPAETDALTALRTIAAIGLGVSLLLSVGLVFVTALVRNGAATKGLRRLPPLPKLPDPAAPPPARPFVLHIGKSTGTLVGMGHAAGIAPGCDVALVNDDASQNIVIYGGIGSGKTSCGINRFVMQSLRQACGMLVFDVKGDYGRTLKALAGTIGRPVVTIGVGGRPFNLLAGLTPEVAASFLKSAFILAGSGSNAVIYVDTATNLARNTLGLLSYFPDEYSLRGLYDAVFDKDAAKRLRERIVPLRDRLYHTDRLAYNRLSNYYKYVTDVFPAFENKIKQGARTQLSQILDAFQLEEIDRAFCRGGAGAISMDEVMDGTVFLLDLPISIYGLSAKTVYTLVKLRFFNTVQRRRTETTWNQWRPLVFVCDEYQQIVSVATDALSDLNFWDTSRSAKCVGIISAQGFESFRAVIGSPALTASLLQNFRQQICFRTEDPETIKRMAFLLGKVSVLHENASTSRGWTALGYSRSNAQQSSVRDEDLINAQLFRSLPRGKALALLSISGSAYDDVLTMDFLEPASERPATNGGIPQRVAARSMW